MKAVLSTVALAAMVAGCIAPSGDSNRDTSDNQVTSDELRAGQKIVETVEQHNLVSDQANEADFQDPRLVNAWGLAFSPIGTAWVAANGRGISFVFNGDGSTVFTVNIPAPQGVKGSSPTGQVFNGVPADFAGDAFILVTEDGTVAGWQSGTDAALRFVADDGAIYKGVAIAQAHKERRLYATDFHNDKIDVFDSGYHLVRGEKGFVDQGLPAGFAPFNVFAYKDVLIVTYAKQDADLADDVAGPGNGFVDAFDVEGRLLKRLITRGELNSPWGVAVAPDDFGRASNKLLVGNFGDGRINAYDVSMRASEVNVKFAGQLGTKDHRPLVIDGLWALAFGPGVNGFDDDEIYFTAGPDDEEHGLFGELSVAAKKK
jgi:uncharacterized protein (TIGR03118 family)